LPPVHINYVAVIASSLLAMGIALAWFSPYMFGPIWNASAGKKGLDLSRKSPAFSLMLLAVLLESYVLAHFEAYAVAITPLDGARIGLWLALGIALPPLVGIGLFAGRSWRWFLVAFGYFGISLMIMGIVLVTWT